MPRSTTSCSTRPARRDAGFSLAELAIVLILIGLLGSSALYSLSGQRQQTENQSARQQLDTAREALIGHALVHGRLPCAADPSLPLSHPQAGLENCPRQAGHLPWATLALPASDPWGHPLSYFASQNFITTPPAGQTAFSLDTEGTATLRDSSGKTLAGSLPAIVLSHGRNGPQAPASAEETENADHDADFASRTPGDSFDDLLIWLPGTVLKARLLAAGRLP